MTDSPLGRDELERHGALLFGYGWKSSLADHLDINRKTVSRWISDDAVPEWAAARLRDMVRIAPPPSGSTADEDRDDACAEAIEPELTRLVATAEAAGWVRAEVSVAIIALAVSDVRNSAGSAAAFELLDQIRRAIESAPDR